MMTAIGLWALTTILGIAVVGLPVLTHFDRSR